MKAIKYIVCLSFLFITSCSTLVLKPADFAWPLESVLSVGNEGEVEIQRYSITFNVKELFLKETGDSLGYQNRNIHVIRNTKGFYFMVGDNFRNVFVFNVYDGTFKLDNTIQISDTAKIENPAFNQRPPYVELVYGDNKTINLTEEGIIREEEEK